MDFKLLALLALLGLVTFAWHTATEKLASMKKQADAEKQRHTELEEELQRLDSALNTAKAMIAELERPRKLLEDAESEVAHMKAQAQADIERWRQEAAESASPAPAPTEAPNPAQLLETQKSVTEALEQAELVLHKANDLAEQLLTEAKAQAARITFEAHHKASERLHVAEALADQIVAEAQSGLRSETPTPATAPPAA